MSAQQPQSSLIYGLFLAHTVYFNWYHLSLRVWGSFLYLTAIGSLVLKC